MSLPLIMMLSGKSPNEVSQLEIALDIRFDYIGVSTPVNLAEGSTYFEIEVRENYKNAYFWLAKLSLGIILFSSFFKLLLSPTRGQSRFRNIAGVDSMEGAMALVFFSYFWMMVISLLVIV